MRRTLARARVSPPRPFGMSRHVSSPVDDGRSPHYGLASRSMRRVVLAACDEDRSPVAFARAVAPLLDASVRLVRIRSTSGLTDAESDLDTHAVFAGAHVEHAASAAAG